MRRKDLSSHLIHFTKGNSKEEAFERLKTILRGGYLKPGKGMIRSSEECVCFTETPLEAVASGFNGRYGQRRYSDFGIMFSKEAIYNEGGRPVIYQPESEYTQLPQSIRYRHVRYEPPQIDFTWEREWRLKSDLYFNPGDAYVVLPDDSWEQRLRNDFESEQNNQILLHTLILGTLAECMRQDFDWQITIISTK
ncbi:MAG: hypothetical protein H6592_11295 [Flavobacteriales bacterium]|nr:hypothetical protein [Flavobacteriales bacterium]